MQLNPHLNFNGQCKAAFEFYAKVLGGKITMMLTYGDSPLAEQTPADLRNGIIHATLALGDHVLTGADAPPEHYQKPQGFHVLLDAPDPAEADRIFNALADQGSVQMAIEETFWALRFGMLVDQFGTPWMINCGKPA
jgi:PhnB protein